MNEVASHAQVVVEDIEVSSDLDRCIFDDEANPCYGLSLAEQDQLRQQFVHHAYARYLAQSDVYAAYAQRVAGSRPESLETTSSAWSTIPRLPTSIFKRRDVLATSPQDIAKRCLSSGTRGPVSVVPRDRASLERLLGSVRQGLTLINPWYEDEVAVVNLGPGRYEAGDIWFPYVMSLIELLFPTTNCVVDGAFDPDLAIRLIEEGLDCAEQVGIVGPPFFVLDVMKRIEARGLKLPCHDRCTVLTAGGWKTRAGEAIGRGDFTARVGEALRLGDASQVRDIFNQVELNTVLFECSARTKHVPPWVHPAALDPTTWTELPDGEPGLLSFLDGSALSYPAFIVGDDVGRVWRGKCGCGREGVFVDVLRRVEGRAQRGCSQALAGRYGGKA